MKKIINGKLYDTDTAKAIAGKEENYGRNDFRTFCETLYKKKTGEYFLAGKGGPLTKYVDNCNGLKGFGEAIIPLTTKEAKSWVETNLPAKAYIDLFGEPEE